MTDLRYKGTRGQGEIGSSNQLPTTNYQLPMPNAPCPMPNSILLTILCSPHYGNLNLNNKYFLSLWLERNLGCRTTQLCIS
ncbi:MAG: hypothetical protein AAF630_03415 [Cyanobacteria bacterium P01_C01_bin.38]